MAKKIKILSTNSLLEVMRKHISKEDEPMAHIDSF